MESCYGFKDFKMVQVPTDSNMADLNTKPPGGQRIRYLMKFLGVGKVKTKQE